MKNQLIVPAKFLVKTGFKVFVVVGLLLMTSFEENTKEDIELASHQLTVSQGVTGTITQVNTQFRTTMQSILSQVSRENGLPELDEDFVMVNPMSGFVSPVVLTKDSRTATLPDLEKGKVILLSYFNLPDDSEISSGFYLLNVRKSSGEWIAELRSLDGKTVITKKPVVEIRSFSNVYSGRQASVFDGKYAVRFGAQLKEVSFYIDIKLGSSKNVITPQDNYSQAVMKEIMRFRGQIEEIMKNALTIKGDVFISSGKDALLIQALGVSGANVVPTMFISSKNIPADFYTVNRINSQLKGQILMQTVSATFTDFSRFSSLNIGFTGGMLGDKIHAGYVGNLIKGEYHFPL